MTAKDYMLRFPNDAFTKSAFLGCARQGRTAGAVEEIEVGVGYGDRGSIVIDYRHCGREGRAGNLCHADLCALTAVYAIAEEGLRGDWGAGIGKVLMATGYGDARTKAKAWAAAGSDARMGGCEMAVVINSGSGNQGLTVSLPVVAYARELGSGEEETLKALALANLVAIHQKDGIGCLSAFCGATTAAAGAGAGVAYLLTKDYRTVVHTIVNTLAILPGMACDGAKPSCAAKIAEAVDAALLGCDMIMAGKQFYGGEGLVTKGVEATIRNIARLGHDGMRETNGEIIRMMLASGGGGEDGARSRREE